LENLANTSLEELEKTKDIGPIVAQSIYSWFREERNLNFLKKLKEKGVKIIQEKQRGNKLRGLTFVLTGTLKSMTRNDAKEKIKNLGGEVLSSISKNLDYLVVGENPGSKYKKAKKIGIKILSEPEFLKMIKAD
jgi:DNA ligase (NAD+)